MLLVGLLKTPPLSFRPLPASCTRPVSDHPPFWMMLCLTVLTPDIEKAMLKHTPLGRLGEGNDIAYAALYLCSPAAAWVSGQVLTVSGGGVQELD